MSFIESAEPFVSAIEHVERERYGIAALAGVVLLVCALGFGLPLVLSAVLAVASGLLAGGGYAARRFTSQHLWSLVEADAAAHGYRSTKRRLWLSNLAPGVLVLVLALLLAGAV